MKLPKKKRGKEGVAVKNALGSCVVVLFVLAQLYDSWKVLEGNRHRLNTTLFVDDTNSFEVDNLFCPSVLIKTGAKLSSTSQVWNNLKHQIVKSAK